MTVEELNKKHYKESYSTGILDIDTESINHTNFSIQFTISVLEKMREVIYVDYAVSKEDIEDCNNYENTLKLFNTKINKLKEQLK